MSGRVFLSYWHDGPDRAYVERLAGYLSSVGVDCSAQAVDEAGAVVVVMSPGAHGSDWVQYDLGQALDAGLPILPLLLAGQPFYELGNLAYEDVSDGRLPGPGFVNELRRLAAPTVYSGPPRPQPPVRSSSGPTGGPVSYPRQPSQPGQPGQYGQPGRPVPPPPPPPRPTRRGSGRTFKMPFLSLILRLACSGAAVWLTTLLLPGITVTAKSTGGTIGTVLLVAVIFGVINAVLKPIVKFVGCGLYVLTLGLISLVVNGALFLLASFVAGKLDIPFHVDKFWPSAVLGALLVSLVSWGLGLIVKDRGER